MFVYRGKLKRGQTWSRWEAYLLCAKRFPPVLGLLYLISNQGRLSLVICRREKLSLVKGNGSSILARLSNRSGSARERDPTTCHSRLWRRISRRAHASINFWALK